jgi:hypothetical protein
MPYISGRREYYFAEMVSRDDISPSTSENLWLPHFAFLPIDNFFFFADEASLKKQTNRDRHGFIRKLFLSSSYSFYPVQLVETKRKKRKNYETRTMTKKR